MTYALTCHHAAAPCARSAMAKGMAAALAAGLTFKPMSGAPPDAMCGNAGL